MGGICERPGCNRPAAAAVAADPRRLIVWVGDLATSAETVNALCAPHADNLAVPLGWERRDLRDLPHLVAVPSPDTVAAEALPPKPRRRSGRKGSPSMASAVVRSPGADPAPAPVAGYNPSAIPAAPSAPLNELHRVRAELSADTAALLNAGGDTPLLARAFRTVRVAG